MEKRNCQYKNVIVRDDLFRKLPTPGAPDAPKFSQSGALGMYHAVVRTKSGTLALNSLENWSEKCHFRNVPSRGTNVEWHFSGVEWHFSGEKWHFRNVPSRGTNVKWPFSGKFRCVGCAGCHHFFHFGWSRCENSADWPTNEIIDPTASGPASNKFRI